MKTYIITAVIALVVVIAVAKIPQLRKIAGL